MKLKKKDKGSDNLLSIPGIGKSLAEDLREIGVHRIQDLTGKDPQSLFKDLCTLHQMKIDPCVLYAFRCAVYYAENDEHDPELLKWWNWKTRTK
jgi:hypothetical protein